MWELSTDVAFKDVFCVAEEEQQLSTKEEELLAVFMLKGLCPAGNILTLT